MARWIKIAEIEDVPIGTGRAFAIEGSSIAVFNVDGKWYAIDDSCPHQGSSLATGRLDGPIVTCRSHGMKINVTAGKEQPGIGLNTQSFPLELRTDGLYVGLEEATTTRDDASRERHDQH